MTPKTNTGGRVGAPGPSTSKVSAGDQIRAVWSSKKHQDGCSPSPCCGPEMIPSYHHSPRAAPSSAGPAQGWRWRWRWVEMAMFCDSWGHSRQGPLLKVLLSCFGSLLPFMPLGSESPRKVGWELWRPLVPTLLKAGPTSERVILLSAHPDVVPASPRMKH